MTYLKPTQMIEPLYLPPECRILTRHLEMAWFSLPFEAQRLTPKLMREARPELIYSKQTRAAEPPYSLLACYISLPIWRTPSFIVPRVCHVLLHRRQERIRVGLLDEAVDDLASAKTGRLTPLPVKLLLAIDDLVEDRVFIVDVALVPHCFFALEVLLKVLVDVGSEEACMALGSVSSVSLLLIRIRRLLLGCSWNSWHG